MQLKIGKKERLHIHSCDILISHLYTIRKKKREAYCYMADLKNVLIKMTETFPPLLH